MATSAKKRKVTGDEVTFERIETFKWADLESCPGEIAGRVFATRNEHYFFRWRLDIRPRKEQRDGSKQVEVELLLLTDRPYVLESTTRWTVFCEKRATRTKRHQLPYAEFLTTILDDNKRILFPSVTEIKDCGYVGADGLVRIGVKLSMQQSAFAPEKYSFPLVKPKHRQNRRRPNPHMKRLFTNCVSGDDKRCTDFKIRVGEDDNQKVFHASSVILLASPYFKTLFSSENWQENKENEIKLPQNTPDAVKEALRHIYLDDFGRKLVDHLPELLDLGEMWQLQSSFKKGIEQQMMEFIFHANSTSSDVRELLVKYADWAGRYDLKALQRVLFAKIIDQWTLYAPLLRSLKKHELMADISTVIYELEGVTQ